MTAEEHELMVRCLATHLETVHGARATRITTHISSIVLCGERAYKIKQPVSLPFVDFSTLEKRQYFCLEELRLNQRTAPDIYLVVEAISGTLELPRLGATGPVLDYAVVMKRFPTTNLLSERSISGLLDKTDTDLLAQHLGEFAKHSLPIGLIPDSKVKRAIDWTLESLDEINASEMANQAVDICAVTDFIKQQFQRLNALDKTRQAQGCYRECHGDLHLANLVRLGDRVMAFDALEFEPALRMVDIISDVAFPFMDLLAHRHEALAWRFISQWCEHTGDYEALRLLPFYTTYRAVVRAKVAVLSRDASGFEQYWHLVRRLCNQTSPTVMARQHPRVILVSGLSGSGKSTVALKIACSLGGIRLRADAERKRLHPNFLNKPESLYGDEASMRTYDRLLELTHLLHDEGIHAIADATFLTQERVRPFVDDFDGHRFDNPHKPICLLVRCKAPVQTLKSRLNARQKLGLDPSDATVVILEKQLKRAGRIANLASEPSPCNTIEIVNDGTLSELELKIDWLVTNLTEVS